MVFESVYLDLERPLVPVLVAIERAGVRIDSSALATMSTRIGHDLEARQHDIHTTAGVAFNINSPKQLSEVLFERLQLTPVRRTGKTKAASTSVQVLEELSLTHELPRKVLEWRSLQKLKGTYIDALPQLVNSETGRVHTSFNQAVAATGRLSSRDPNLQNIPIRTELGREIRRTFIAEPGTVLISADYSQIELRVLAHLSGDETLIEAFRRAARTSTTRQPARSSGLRAASTPHELRRRAKIVNYALLYRKDRVHTCPRYRREPTSGAAVQSMPTLQAFPQYERISTPWVEQARTTGVVTTMWGRRRLRPRAHEPQRSDPGGGGARATIQHADPGNRC